MAGTTGFDRSVIDRPGVQLNPLVDNTDFAGSTAADQVFAIAGRFTRGRIDKPFKVDKGNYRRKLGAGETIRQSALNVAYVHVAEALDKGAFEAVVQRLATSSAVVKWAVASLVDAGSGASFTATVAGGVITGATGSGGTGYDSNATITVGGPGTGAVLTLTVTNGVLSVTVAAGGTGFTTAPTLTVVPGKTIAFSVSETEPDGETLLFGLKHLECFNDGIKLEVRADEVRTGGVAQATDYITVIVKDPAGQKLYSFVGSLDPAAQDDFQQSAYLPDIVAGRTDVFEAVTGSITSVPAKSSFYGYDANRRERVAASSTLICFVEGGTGYSVDDYAAAKTKLHLTPHAYGYIAGGGTQSTALIAQLVQLAYDTNRQFALDIPGDLTPDEAIAFKDQLSLESSETAHLIQAYWAPVKHNDPTGINGKGYFGRSAWNIAKRCARNAIKNAYGFPRKQQAIAGIGYPLDNQSLTQTYFPDPQELERLAKARINPVLFMSFSAGTFCVFTDQLTAAPVTRSQRKLTSVAEMSTHIDDLVVRLSNELLNLPLLDVISRAEKRLTTMLENARHSEWLVPTLELPLGYRFELAESEDRPADRVKVSIFAHFNGATRQIEISQYLA